MSEAATADVTVEVPMEATTKPVAASKMAPAPEKKGFSFESVPLSAMCAVAFVIMLGVILIALGYSDEGDD